jgi:mRNA interferase RelE/StbE
MSYRVIFKKVLRRRAEAPRVPAARVHGYPDTYKIKLRDAGYRLAYRVIDEKLVIFVIGVGRRDEGYDELLRAGSDSLSGLD